MYVQNNFFVPFIFIPDRSLWHHNMFHLSSFSQLSFALSPVHFPVFVLVVTPVTTAGLTVGWTTLHNKMK